MATVIDIFHVLGLIIGGLFILFCLFKSEPRDRNKDS